jgi:hypothetical protein
MVILLLLAYFPARWLGRWALAGAAAAMLAIFGISLAIILGPNSDTSIHESNWATHSAHGFFVGVLAANLAVAAGFAYLAFRPPRPAVIRTCFVAVGLGTFALTYLVAFAMSN